MRTCARVSVDDCKEVNGVMYCYCRHNLCNSPDRKLADPPKQHHHHHKQHPKDTSSSGYPQYGDDEDQDGEEGSGGHDMYNYDDDAHDDLFDYGDDDEESSYPTDYSDMTEPPPSIKQELEEEYKKIEKELLDNSNTNNNIDIGFEENIQSRNNYQNAAAPPEVSGSPRSYMPGCGTWLAVWMGMSSSALLLLMS